MITCNKIAENVMQSTQQYGHSNKRKVLLLKKKKQTEIQFVNFRNLG